MKDFPRLIFNLELPDTCPDKPTPETCGAVAANYLLESMFVTWDDNGIAHIDDFGASTKKILDRKTEPESHDWPKVEFGCLACGKCVKIMTEPFGYDESVTISE